MATKGKWTQMVLSLKYFDNRYKSVTFAPALLKRP